MKDNRYKALKSLIEAGGVENLKDVFDYIPITIVGSDLKMHYNTLRRRVDRTELLTLHDIKSLAELLQVEDVLVFKLALNQFEKQKKKTSRSLK